MPIFPIEDPYDYEIAVGELVQQIAKSKKINLLEEPRGGRENKIEGASGYKHQIDISCKYKSKDDIKRLKIIECKLKSEFIKRPKVGINEMLIFHARIRDIQEYFGDNYWVEGNMITTNGYTRNVANYANHYRDKISINTYQKDKKVFSITFADEIVVGLRPAKLNLSA